MYHHKWLYHETLAPAGKMFKSDAEEAAAGEGWVDTPAKFGQAGAATVAPPDPPAMTMTMAPVDEDTEDAPPAAAPAPRRPRR